MGQARPIILSTGGAILEQMACLDARRQPGITLQVGALSVGVRRHAHVAYQHRRPTIRILFPYGSLWRHRFPHIFCDLDQPILLTAPCCHWQVKEMPDSLRVLLARIGRRFDAFVEAVVSYDDIHAQPVILENICGPFRLYIAMYLEVSQSTYRLFIPPEL